MTTGQHQVQLNHHEEYHESSACDNGCIISFVILDTRHSLKKKISWVMGHRIFLTLQWLIKQMSQEKNYRFEMSVTGSEIK